MYLRATNPPGTTGLGSPVILTWTSTLTNVAYTVCWDQTPDGTCSGVWWPNGGSKVKWLENLAAGTYYWQVRAQTPTGYVYADGEPTSWAFTVGGDPAAASDPTDDAGMMSDRGAGAPAPTPVLGCLAATAWLLAITGLLRVRRSRPRRVRPWALPAWLSLVALLWPAGVAAQGGERVEYYHLDALGSVRVVTDASGQVVRRHDFGPFGEEVAAVYPNPERKLFTGHERDAETALDYFGARYYRADLGRFATVDPELNIKGALLDPQRWNRYAYVTNNPLKYTDPDGKNPLLIMGGIGAVVYAGWNAHVNVQQGQPWYQNIGVEAGRGFVVGATLGTAGAVLALGRVVTTGTALTAPAIETDIVVIGHFPRYLELARELGAKAFEVPPGVWDKMSEAEQLAANNRFLDRAIARGQTFIVTMNVTDALKNGGVWLKHEIEYLLARGYTIGQGGRSLIPPAK